jgi:ligand-binding sensor domain-containing protein
VKVLVLDSDGTIWAGGNPTEGRPPPITAYRGQDADPTWQYSEPINQQLSSLFGDSFESLRITSMFIDTSGGFWLGLQEAGIVYVSQNEAVHFSEEEGVGGPGLEDRRIRRILVDQNGTVWAAASEQGLLRLKPGAGVWETVDLGSQGAYISAVSEFADGSLWAGGNNIVGRSSDGGETWDQVGSEEGLGAEISALVEDEDGRVWAGAYDGGVSIWDGERWTAFQQ